jgi:hypothetical protein
MIDELITALENMIQRVEYLAPESFDDDEQRDNFFSEIEAARATLEKAKGA